jgi:hypothetical protein
LDEPEISPPPPPPSLPFRRPADYYSTPVDDRRRLFPRGVTIGCGSVSIVVVIALFVLGGMAANGKFGSLFGLVFGQLQVELQGQFTKDVTPAQKAAFNAEMKTLLDHLDKSAVPLDRLQPLMRTVRDVSGDGKVDGKEVERLVAALREVNGTRASSRP